MREAYSYGVSTGVRMQLLFAYYKLRHLGTTLADCQSVACVGPDQNDFLEDKVISVGLDDRKLC
jgi:hypothetical protein